jgi:hypothetical protein
MAAKRKLTASDIYLRLLQAEREELRRVIDDLTAQVPSRAALVFALMERDRIDAEFRNLQEMMSA